MSFCSFSKDFSKNSITSIQNTFITDYLTDASGDAVKVYIYGLFLCENSSEEISISDFSKNLYISEDKVMDYFKFWEEYGIVSIISADPFTVKYLSLSKTGKPRKFKPEKYSDFNKAVQTLITERMISPNEYSEYFSIMEDNSIKPEAMLMIVKYCVDLKGANIGFRYITTVARDFASRQITNVEAIEQELSDYMTRTSDIQSILSALGIKRKPDIDDLKLFNKWRTELQFEIESIIFAAKIIKARSIEKLDEFITELYNNKCFSEKEISGYVKNADIIRETAKKVANELGVYVENKQPYIKNYISPWFSKGYNEETLIFIANYCFRKKKKSFEEMNETIDTLYSLGLVTLESIVLYLKNVSIDDTFIKKLLSIALAERKPNSFDRESVRTWREWGFSDEMLVEAAKLAQGKNNPISYINVVLSNWKTQNIFTTDKIPNQKPSSANGKTNNANAEINAHSYTKEDFESIFTKLDEVDF